MNKNLPENAEQNMFGGRIFFKPKLFFFQVLLAQIIFGPNIQHLLACVNEHTNCNILQMFIVLVQTLLVG